MSASAIFDVHPGRPGVGPAPPADDRRAAKLQEQLAEAQAVAGDAAAALELVARLASCRQERRGYVQLANDLCDYLGCRCAALGLRRGNRGPCRLVAVSGHTRVDRRSQMAQAIEAAMDEALLRGEPTFWPAPDSAEHLPGLAARQAGAALGAASILCWPLRDDQGEPAGALVVTSDRPLDRDQRTLARLGAVEQPLAAAIALFRQAHRPLVARAALRLLALWADLRSRLIMVVAVVLLALLALPLPYKVKCDCRLEPVTCRFVAAPFEGTLERALVKPGDLVRRGDVLARMDGREIRWQRAALLADRNQAMKKRDAALAAHRYAEAQLARLEMERLDLKIRLLDHRAEHLEIKSPIDGVVTSGDLQRAEGAPLTLGQTLFEIAPLRRMIVEVAVPQDDVAHVQVGQPITVRLDAYPGRRWPLQLARLRPRAELRDDQNVFIAEATADNPDGMLRPGMEGHARITTARHSLGWILLHKPWQSLRMWWGW